MPAYTIKKVVNTLIVIITILISLGLFVSDIAIFVNPEISWIPAFVGLAYVPLFLLGLCVLIVLTLMRSKLAFVPLAALLIGWLNFANTFSLQTAKEPERISGDTLRIMTWNTHHFNYRQDIGAEENKKEMLDLINDYKPDVLCMQEFSLDGRDVKERIEKMQAYLEMKDHAFQALEAKDKGLVIFSRYPINDSKLIPFQVKQSGNHCLYADININGKMLRVYTVHLESIRLDENQVGYIRELTKGKKEDIRPGKVIAGQLKRAFLKRAEQVKIVRASTDSCSSPFIICGDFNDPPSSFAFRQMQEGLTNSFRAKGSGIIPITYHRSVFKYQIDHIMASPSIAVCGHYIVRKKLSDHYPVISDFRLGQN